MPAISNAIEIEMLPQREIMLMDRMQDRKEITIKAEAMPVARKAEGLVEGLVAHKEAEIIKWEDLAGTVVEALVDQEEEEETVAEWAVIGIITGIIVGIKEIDSLEEIIVAITIVAAIHEAEVAVWAAIVAIESI